MEKVMFGYSINCGVTGTREGCSDKQMRQLRKIVSEICKNHTHVSFRHGDCIGVDAEAHDLFEFFKNCKITVHPPIKSNNRAFKQGHTILKEEAYYTRDEKIVNNSSVMISVPLSMEDKRGGTWYTTKYALKKKKKVILITPEGEIKKYNFTST